LRKGVTNKHTIARLKSNILPPKFWADYATEWSYNRKTSSHFLICWRVLFSETWHCKYCTSVPKSHWNNKRNMYFQRFSKIR